MDTEIINVLLIENNPVQALIFKQMLKRAKTGNFNITYFQNLQLAISFLTTQKCDIILTDLFLSDSKGLNTLIRLQTVKPDVPILILTAFNDEKLALESVKKGAQDYLVKDKITQDSLIRCLKYGIERHKFTALIEEKNYLLKQANEKLQDQNQELILINQKLATVTNNLEKEVKQQNLNLETALGDCKNFEQTLEKLVAGTSSVIGDDFFAALVVNLSSVLDVRYGLVSELIDEDQLYTIAFSDHGQIQSNFSHGFKNTPCEQSMILGQYYCLNELNQKFPEHTQLVSLKAESYYGIALKDSANQVIGNLCILDDKPIKNIEQIEAIIKIFATRGAAEIERHRAKQKLQTLNEQLEIRVEERTKELKTSQEILRESEELLRLTIENTPIGIVTSLSTGTFKTVNSAFCQMLGYEKEELLTMNFRELTHPDDQENSGQQIEELIENKISQFTLEKRYIHKNGNLIYGIVRVGCIQGCEINNTQLVATVHDITDRKQKEAELHKSLKELSDFKYALDEAAIVTITDVNGKITYANNKFCQITKYELNEVIGKKHQIINSSYHNKEIFFDLWQTITKGKIWRGELKNRTKNGDFYWIDNTIVPFLDEENKPVQYLSISTDITSRKEVESALYKSNKLLQQQLAAIESANDGIGILNLEGEYIYINNAHLALFGYQKPEDLLGKTWHIFYDSSQIKRLQTEILPLLYNQRKWRGELVAHRKDGTNFTQEMSLTLIEKVGIVCVSQDISDRKKAEENILKSLAKEKELNQLKSRFVSMTSHEFRTPLSIISSSAGILELYGDRLESKKQEKHLKRIQTSVYNMTQLLEDILIINYSETNNIEFNPINLDLVTFCNELLEDLESNFINHSLISRINPKHNFLVYLDQKLIRQILTNLLSNASKYSPIGSKIYFEVSQAKNMVIFKIQDEGIGIPLEDQPRLFESFHRGLNVGNIQGTGLGLAIVKKCVQMHQGKITFSSKIEKGTTFMVQIPLKYR